MDATSDRPIIGKMYKVLCLRVEPLFLGQHWHPILGPKHGDPILNFPALHYHIDWRFVSDDTYEWACGGRNTPHSRVISNTHETRDGLINEPVLKRRKCYREMPEFPAVGSDVGKRSGEVWSAMEIDQRQRCDHLIDGHICPHRGIDLRQFAKEDGTAICPGHGLRWNLTTGAMIARHAKGQA